MTGGDKNVIVRLTVLHSEKQQANIDFPTQMKSPAGSFLFVIFIYRFICDLFSSNSTKSTPVIVQYTFGWSMRSFNIKFDSIFFCYFERLFLVYTQIYYNRSILFCLLSEFCACFIFPQYSSLVLLFYCVSG